MTDVRGSTAAGAEAATGAGGAKGPDELRRQVAQARRSLGNTVGELAARADVKGRAAARAADLRDRAGALSVQVRSSMGTAVEAGRRHPRPVLAVAAGTLGAGAAAGIRWLRRR